MKHYQSSAELKAAAKECMFGNYGVAVGAILLNALIVGVVNLIVLSFTNTQTIAGTVVYYLISFIVSLLTGLLSSGTCYFYLKITCGRPVSIGDIFYGFKLCPDKTIAIMAWTGVLNYAALLPQMILTYQMGRVPLDSASAAALMLPYSLSTVFSGIVSVLIQLLYGQALFLLHDFPQYSAKELLKMSRRLMSGHKARLFYIYVSFIPLFLLSLLSCGIAFLWVIPYMNATLAEFFLDIIRKS